MEVKVVSKDGYGDFPDWDARGVIRSSIRRVVLLVTKGLDEKENLFMVAETLLTQIDDEENFQRVELPREKHREYGQ